ncbi:MAG: RNA methyltransferase [Clostridia bacterium]|nr:RNA methyltransferase [Clostridia bacterium]
MKTPEEKYADSSFVEGALSVLTVLKGSSREVYEVVVSDSCDRENKNAAQVLSLCAEKGIAVTEKSAEDFSREFSGANNGGIAARVGERKLVSLSELLSKKDGFFFMLCGLEDPYNFGDCVRSLYAFGADGMILSPRSWMSAASVTVRASAGATELIDCAVCDDENELFRLCRENGIKIVCADEKDAEPLHRTKLSRPMLLVIGGERRGISHALLENADKKIRIGYGRNFNRSLSASAAASVFGFEFNRQERANKFRSSHSSDTSKNHPRRNK